MLFKIELPEILEEEKTSTVTALLNIISQLADLNNKQAIEIQQLKDEIAKLKGTNPKPKIRPSKISKNDDDLNGKKNENSEGKRPGSKKRKKKEELEIHEIKTLHPPDIPEGSEFKGYSDYTVQNIIIKPNNILYRRERWLTPSGVWIIADLPDNVKSHYGSELQVYMLHLNYELNVTQPKIWETLTQNIGIDISKGHISNILIENKDIFHEEKQALLEAGLRFSDYIVVDDTGARHKGKNGYCTHIGNEFFAWYKSTNSKSRINFLNLLRGKYTDYIIDEDALFYIENQSLAKEKLMLLKRAAGRELKNKAEWEKFLKMVGIRTKKDVRIATEGALIGSILSHGINKDIVIISDDAGQFNILLHGLCWIHAERKINDLIPINDYQQKIIDEIRDKIWDLYAKLKAYKKSPDEIKKIDLSIEFDEIFNNTKTEFDNINKVLKLLHANKKELLMVLKRPEIPLHNNISENDIRVMAEKRKVHSGTRSDNGRDCRDTFMSLKKTCRKLKIQFCDYLLDRISGKNEIPLLNEIIQQKILTGT